MTAPRCLVTGATGYIGGRLVPRLLEAGHDVRVLARTPAKLDGVPWADRVEVVEGDLGDVDSLERAATDMDVFYNLVHSMGGSDDFAAEEAANARNIVAATSAVGVGRVVYLSGLHPRDDDNWSTHLASRIEVGRILMAGPVPTVVLQAGVVIGSGSASFELIRHLTERLPVMTTPKWVHNRIQPIAITDALHYLVAAATADMATDRGWDIGSPDVMTYGEMMSTYARVAGLGRRHLLVLRPLTPTLASRWVGLVTPIPPGLARPLIESLECDAVMVDHDIDGVIPPPERGLVSYEDAVRAAIDHDHQGVVDLGWDDVDPLGEPAAPLPSDPDWSGELLLTHDTQLHIDAPEAAVRSGCPQPGRHRRWPRSPAHRPAVRGRVDRQRRRARQQRRQRQRRQQRQRRGPALGRCPRGHVGAHPVVGARAAAGRPVARGSDATPTTTPARPWASAWSVRHTVWEGSPGGRP